MRAVALGLLGAAVGATLAAPLHAQQPLRVVRRTPSDSVGPLTAIEIVFDRPVAGALNASDGPPRAVRLEPDFERHTEWRDPVTLRIAPRQPLAPGHEHTITVGPELVALGGGRLAEPYRFTFRVRPPLLLASKPYLEPSNVAALPPSGAIFLQYETPVDSEPFARLARLELTGGGACRGVVRYRLASQRPVSPADLNDYTYGGWWRYGWRARDSVTDRLRSVVELRPERPLPEGCRGVAWLPSLDAGAGDGVRYRVSTPPPFTLVAARCADVVGCGGDGIVVQFSAPVRRADVASRVHLEPARPFVVQSYPDESDSWVLRTPLAPRTSYRIAVDSGLRDVYGRPLTGSRATTLTTGDLAPAAAYGTGLLTVPRAAPTIRVRHVNADSAEVVVVAIPESLRAKALADYGQYRRGYDWRRARTLDSLPGGVRARAVVPLRGAFNQEALSDVPLPLPARAGGASALLAVRVSVWRSRQSPDGGPEGRDAGAPADRPRRRARDRSRRLPEVVVTTTVDFGQGAAPIVLLQASDLVAHLKSDGRGGEMFVTDARSGRPVGGARVTLRDSLDRVLAAGLTAADGTAALVPVDAGRPRAPRARADTAGDGWGSSDEHLARYAEVARDGDRAIVSAVAAPSTDELDPYLLGAGYGGGTDARAALYTSRDIYRPGEVVHAGAVVRLGPLGELRAPAAGDSVRLEVTRQSAGERGDEVRDTVLALSEFGTAADSFALRPGASLGLYFLRLGVRRGDRWRVAGVTTFRVAEYRAPEFLVTLAGDSAVRMLGDTVRGRGAARFLFGAPMVGAAARWQATLEELDAGELVVPGLPPRYAIGDHSGWWDTHRPWRGASWQGGGTLDARGELSVTVPTTPGTITRPGRLTMEVAAEDLNRQVVSAIATTTVHAAALYVAAHDSAGSWSWSEGLPRAVRVLAVRPDGRRVAGVRVRATVVRREWRTAYDSVTHSPSSAWVVADTVARDSVLTADSAVVLHFTPRREGPHEVVLSAADDAGRPTTTTLGGYVIPRRWAGAWAQNPVRLPLVAARDELAPGDTAVVSFTSPFDSAEAWVTVEREGVLDRRRLTLRAGPTTLRLPLAERHVPRAFVSVVLVRRAPATSADSLYEGLRAGYLMLEVSDSVKRLAVDVRPEGRESRPGDSVTIAVRVRDAARRGVRSEVTLWAVDEGVLSLTGYTVPDVLAKLHEGSRGLGLLFHSALESYARARRPEALDSWRGRLRLRGMVSLSSALAAQAMTVISRDAQTTGLRTDFRATAFYVASLVTDDDGVARARVRLPDNVTTFRVMAVAVAAGDRYGKGEAPLLVTKPLLARAAMPRFVRPGDELLAGATVNSRDGAALPVRVRAEGSGLRLEGDAEQRRVLEHGRGAEARFRWRAVEADTARVRFAVATTTTTTDRAPLADAVEVALPVRPTYSPRAFTAAGTVRDTETVRLELPPGIDPDRSRLTVRVGTLPLTHVRAAYERVRVYPYDCSEQVASAGRVVVALLRLRAAGVPVAADSARLRAELQTAADVLARRQGANGAIGYWTRDHWSTPWLSAYVGLFLADARDLGATVDEGALRRLAVFLTRALEDSAARPDTSYGTRDERGRLFAAGLSGRLAALHFLRRVGTPRESAEDQLLALAPRLTWEDRAWLAELLARRSDRRSARELVAALWRDVSVAGGLVDLPDSVLRTTGFPSHVRPPARLLAATIAAAPEHALLGALVERVAQQGRAGRGALRWAWNTQDYAALAAALSDASRLSLAREGVAVVVRSAAPGGSAGAPLLERVVGAATADSSVPLTGLVVDGRGGPELPLRLESRGGAAYYWLTVTEVPRERPTASESRGITVQRWYERLEDGHPVTAVRAGELVRVRLRVIVPSDREFVALEDPLPAGLEVVDLSLGGSTTIAAGRASAPSRGDGDGSGNESWRATLYGSWYGGWWSPWEHTELRDDRVLYFARVLWSGTYAASYVARATTTGRFVQPPAHAEEMYDPALNGRSDGGTFRVEEAGR